MKTSDYEKFMEKAAKNREKILALRTAGKTMETIAGSLGITRQRVAQVLKKAGAK